MKIYLERNFGSVKFFLIKGFVSKFIFVKRKTLRDGSQKLQLLCSNENFLFDISDKCSYYMFEIKQNNLLGKYTQSTWP